MQLQILRDAPIIIIIIIAHKENLAAASRLSYCVRAKPAQLAVVIYEDLLVMLERSTK